MPRWMRWGWGFTSGASEKLPLFTKPLSNLKAPLLLMGSDGDNMSRADFQEEYRVIARETGAKIHVFSEGNHPAILSNAEQAAVIICHFLNNRMKAWTDTENRCSCLFPQDGVKMILMKFLDIEDELLEINF